MTVSFSISLRHSSCLRAAVHAVSYDPGDGDGEPVHPVLILTAGKESSCPFTGYCGDEDLLDPLRKFLAEGFKADEARPVTQRSTLTDLLDDCVRSWLKSFEEDYEYQHTLECFKEMAETDGWEFTENGEITH